MDSNNLTGHHPCVAGQLIVAEIHGPWAEPARGTIPPSLGGIPGLRRLTIAFNRLSGELPASIYNLSSLEWLQVQGNKLHGEIPVDIGSKFPSIQILSFAMNQFTGSIPASLSNLTTLQWLDLSYNTLSGHVPSGLGRLRALQSLNLRINRLQADDTLGWEFIASLSNSSQLKELLLSHNAALTGQFPRQKSPFPQLTTEEQYERVSYHALAIGTDGFSEANLLGTGGIGAVYKCTFHGRSPTDDMFDGSFDLHKFSKDAIPDRIWEIVDPTMWLHNDGYNSTTRPRIHNCLVSVIALGISCSRKQPRERIPIQDATIELHAIRDSYLKFAGSPVVENGVAATLK
ncbi:hypothetical protein PR202_gb26424 [Eleusine coracana subsp. coracana]|uniref:Disease resistance R13L4/SHOC-2-like LRR domain-containing protein n=1 Tax=Eleusine coracana subsp. coracana TaxID=191504 RepID=A0AAV5FR47_ELECO|nr:hypothetical protein PR202_gb26424 [Eleusine coracana subsp. coracana]